MICEPGGISVQYWTGLKKSRERGRGFAPAGLGDLSQVIGEFGFFDDEKVFPYSSQSLDKNADPRARHV